MTWVAWSVPKRELGNEMEPEANGQRLIVIRLRRRQFKCKPGEIYDG